MGELLEKLMVVQVTFRSPTFYGIQEILVHRSLPLVPALLHINRIRAIPSCFVNIHLLFDCLSDTFFFKFSNQNFVHCVYSIMCYI
jgi:hypothetical protein